MLTRAFLIATRSAVGGIASQDLRAKMHLVGPGEGHRGSKHLPFALKEHELGQQPGGAGAHHVCAPAGPCS